MCASGGRAAQASRTCDETYRFERVSCAGSTVEGDHGRIGREGGRDQQCSDGACTHGLEGSLRVFDDADADLESEDSELLSIFNSVVGDPLREFFALPLRQFATRLSTQPTQPAKHAPRQPLGSSARRTPCFERCINPPTRRLC